MMTHGGQWPANQHSCMRKLITVSRLSHFIPDESTVLSQWFQDCHQISLWYSRFHLECRSRPSCRVYTGRILDIHLHVHNKAPMYNIYTCMSTFLILICQLKLLESKSPMPSNALHNVGLNNFIHFCKSKHWLKRQGNLAWRPVLGSPLSQILDYPPDSRTIPHGHKVTTNVCYQITGYHSPIVGFSPVNDVADKPLWSMTMKPNVLWVWALWPLRVNQPESSPSLYVPVMRVSGACISTIRAPVSHILYIIRTERGWYTRKNMALREIYSRAYGNIHGNFVCQETWARVFNLPEMGSFQLPVISSHDPYVVDVVDGSGVRVDVPGNTGVLFI